MRFHAPHPVRVEEDVWRQPRVRERHVLCWPEARQDALLAVARRELVSGDGVAVDPVIR